MSYSIKKKKEFGDNQHMFHLIKKISWFKKRTVGKYFNEASAKREKAILELSE